MPTLTLTSTCIAPVSNLSSTLLLDQYVESETVGSRVEVRTYAGGRRRVVSRPGETQTVSVSYRYMTRANYNALSLLVGQTVLFRDQRGRVVYGVIADLSGSEWIVADKVEDVSFTLTEITYSEVV